jgi:hypothetical protein
MRIEAPRKLFTVEEFYRMADAGIFNEDDRVELIDGEILEMSPIGTRHLGSVNGANAIFARLFPGRAVVSVQNTLQLNDFSEPQPDLVLLRWRADAYRRKRPMADDALLVLEVADTTLKFDLEVKLPRYARAGLPEAWIEDLEANRLRVFRDPSPEGYRSSRVLSAGDTVTVAAFPDAPISVAELLG